MFRKPGGIGTCPRNTAAMTRDEAQRSIRTFYEAVKFEMIDGGSGSDAGPKPIAPIFNFTGRGGIGGRKREGSMLRRGLLRYFFKAQDHGLDMVEDVVPHRTHVQMDDQI